MKLSNFPSSSCFVDQIYGDSEQVPKRLQDFPCLVDDQVVVAQLRKKLHQTKSQNFTFKQELSSQKKYILQLQEVNSSLKNEIQQNLQELLISDNQIQRHRTELSESVKYTEFLQQKIRSQQLQLSESQSVIEQQKRYLTNLNQQNLLLIEMKRVINDENTLLRNSFQEVNGKYELRQKQIQKLNIEIDYLIKDIKNLEDLLHNKNEEIQTYEVFLNNKDRQIKLNRFTQVQTLLNDERFSKKLEKYKKKAFRYRQQRDDLLKQIQEAKQQIGTITLRKYFQSDDTMDNNYSFQKQVSSNSYKLS